MTSLTPHRDALNACLSSMRESVAEKAKGSAHEKRVLDLSEELLPILLGPLVDAFDQEQLVDVVAVERALTNVITSFCMTLAGDAQATALRNVRLLLGQVSRRAEAALGGKQRDVSLFQHYADHGSAGHA